MGSSRKRQVKNSGRFELVYVGPDIWCGEMYLVHGKKYFVRELDSSGKRIEIEDGFQTSKMTCKEGEFQAFWKEPAK